jgi:iron-sulfur cluster assembly protein
MPLRYIPVTLRLMMLENILPVTISARAVEEIKKIMSTKGIPEDYGLRLGVRGGGCSATLIIGFDKKQPADREYMVSDICVYINKGHTLFLVGKEVDFFEGAETHGFFFKSA